jgi:N-acetylmuramoyl-L-alanine amidase
VKRCVLTLAVAAALVAAGVAWSLERADAESYDRASAARPPTSWAVGRGSAVAFAAGACRAFAPAARWNGRTVFLDPGHGGPDSGAVTSAPGVRVAEKELTLAIVQPALTLLRRRGFRVVMSRSGDSLVARRRPEDLRGKLLTADAVRRDIVARTTCANAADADALVAIHLNSFSDPGVHGAQTFYNANRPFSPRSRRLASLLQQSVVRSLRRSGWDTVDRGVTTDAAAGGVPLTREAAAYDQLMELGPAAPPWFRDPSLMPGAVVEPLFLTNPDEARLVLTQGGRRTLARGIVRGLELYLAPRSA